MARNEKAKSALTYTRRLLEDEYVQAQLRSAAGELYAAYGRVRRQRAQATEDKRLYRNLRQAATAVRNAAGALQPAKPEPKHRIRKLAVVLAAGGATVWLTMKPERTQSQGKD